MTIQQNVTLTIGFIILFYDVVFLRRAGAFIDGDELDE
jgi:hypothetical protein